MKQPGQNRSDPLTIHPPPMVAPPPKHRRCHERSSYILTVFQWKSLKARRSGCAMLAHGTVTPRHSRSSSSTLNMVCRNHRNTRWRPDLISHSANELGGVGRGEVEFGPSPSAARRAVVTPSLIHPAVAIQLGNNGLVHSSLIKIDLSLRLCMITTSLLPGS